MSGDWHIRLENELLVCPYLTLPQKVQYAYMRFRQGANGSTWCSYAIIARDLSVSIRTAKRTTAELEEIGLVCVVSKGGGRGRANDYRVVPFVEWAENRVKLTPITEPPKGDKLAPISSQKGDNLSNKGCHVVQKRVTDWHPIKNKEKEQEKEQGALSSREGFALLLAQLRTCLRPKDNSGHKSIENVARWACSQGPETIDRVRRIATESQKGEHPACLWMHRLKDELGYIPPTNGQPKPRGVEPERIGACIGRMVVGMGVEV